MWALKLQDPVVQGYLLGIIEFWLWVLVVFLFIHTAKKDL